mmetsp:Transcript_6903/g.23578  ORF Transcript_6903/g.23578 Transcript_6903/m.23578 type:complete len:247 (-) Transcript_6903:470-1210(-)
MSVVRQRPGRGPAGRRPSGVGLSSPPDRIAQRVTTKSSRLAARSCPPSTSRRERRRAVPAQRRIARHHSRRCAPQRRPMDTTAQACANRGRLANRPPPAGSPLTGQLAADRRTGWPQKPAVPASAPGSHQPWRPGRGLSHGRAARSPLWSRPPCRALRVRPPEQMPRSCARRPRACRSSLRDRRPLPPAASLAATGPEARLREGAASGCPRRPSRAPAPFPAPPVVRPPLRTWRSPYGRRPPSWSP